MAAPSSVNSSTCSWASPARSLRKSSIGTTFPQNSSTVPPLAKNSSSACLRSSILPPVHGVNSSSELFEYARQPTHRVLNFWLACCVSIVAHNDLAAPPGDRSDERRVGRERRTGQ